MNNTVTIATHWLFIESIKTIEKKMSDSALGPTVLPGLIRGPKRTCLQKVNLSNKIERNNKIVVPL